MPKKKPNYFHEIGSRVICSDKHCTVADRKIKNGIKRYKLFHIGTKRLFRNVAANSDWHKEYNIMKFYNPFDH